MNLSHRVGSRLKMARLKVSSYDGNHFSAATSFVDMPSGSIPVRRDVLLVAISISDFVLYQSADSLHNVSNSSPSLLSRIFPSFDSYASLIQMIGTTDLQRGLVLMFHQEEAMMVVVILMEIQFRLGIHSQIFKVLDALLNRLYLQDGDGDEDEAEFEMYLIQGSLREWVRRDEVRRSIAKKFKDFFLTYVKPNNDNGDIEYVHLINEMVSAIKCILETITKCSYMFTRILPSGLRMLHNLFLKSWKKFLRMSSLICIQTTKTFTQRA